MYREKAREEKEGERRLWERCVNRLRFSICSDLKKRGVRNVFIACHDNLKGLGDAINAVFSEAKQQLCIVHQVRNSAKFVPWKDRKAVCADLKKIYSAVNLDAAEYAKEEFREKMHDLSESSQERVANMRQLVSSALNWQQRRMIRSFPRMRSTDSTKYSKIMETVREMLRRK